MIYGLKNTDTLNEEQKKIRNKELIGLPLTKREKRLIEWNVKPTGSRKPVWENEDDLDDEIDLEEIIRELEGETDDYDDEEIEINSLTRKELKELINQVLNDM